MRPPQGARVLPGADASCRLLGNCFPAREGNASTLCSASIAQARGYLREAGIHAEEIVHNTLLDASSALLGASSTMEDTHITLQIATRMDALRCSIALDAPSSMLRASSARNGGPMSRTAVAWIVGKKKIVVMTILNGG